MRELADTIQFYILSGCSVLAASLMAAYLLALAAKAFNTWRHTPHAVALAAVAAWAIYVGGAKPPKASMAWDEGLYDAGTEVDTNDLNRIAFRWRYDAWIPPISTVTVSALPIGSSNTFEVVTAPITNLSVTVRMDTEATNYTYLVTHSYTPEPVIKTNGVYHIDCFGSTNRTWVPKGLVIMKDGRPVSYETNAVPPALGPGESEIYILEEEK